MNNETEFTILDTLYQAQVHGTAGSLRQRDLAHTAELSVGMTNMILKRLLTKGFLTAQKVNSRNVQYLVTPIGIEELSRRSYRYFKRTVKNVVQFREAVDRMISRAKRDGYTSVLLVGPSDIDFIVEHECERHGLLFLTSVEPHEAEGALTVFSEELAASDSPDSGNGHVYLRSLIAGAYGAS